jgi:hypothetical protein
MSWIRAREGKHQYPLIDADPHASRVIRYMRPSDYASWAAYTAGTPAVFWAWGELSHLRYKNTESDASRRKD